MLPITEFPRELEIASRTIFLLTAPIIFLVICQIPAVASQTIFDNIQSVLNTNVAIAFVCIAMYLAHERLFLFLIHNIHISLNPNHIGIHVMRGMRSMTSFTIKSTTLTCYYP